MALAILCIACAEFGTAEEKVYYVNEPLTTKLGVTITLLSVTESMGVIEYCRPEKGNIFLLCEFLFENNSDQQIWVYSNDDFGARVDGDEYYVDFSAWAAGACDPAFNKSMRPGQKLQGQVGFEVSQNWSYIDIDYFDWSLFDKTLEWLQYTFRYKKTAQTAKGKAMRPKKVHPWATKLTGARAWRQATAQALFTSRRGQMCALPLHRIQNL